MKLYTPPEMSEKLVALGCTSQSGMYWCLRQGGPIYDAAGGIADYAEDSWILLHLSLIDDDEVSLPAFEFEDFAGELYFENLNKLPFIGKACLNMREPNDLITCGCVPCFRKRIVYSKNWVEEVGMGL